jgi:hypothetical protein
MEWSFQKGPTVQKIGKLSQQNTQLLFEMRSNFLST